MGQNSRSKILPAYIQLFLLDPNNNWGFQSCTAPIKYFTTVCKIHLYEPIMCMTHDEHFHSLTSINRIIILNGYCQ